MPNLDDGYTRTPITDEIDKLITDGATDARELVDKSQALDQSGDDPGAVMALIASVSALQTTVLRTIHELSLALDCIGNLVATPEAIERVEAEHERLSGGGVGDVDLAATLAKLFGEAVASERVTGDVENESEVNA